MSEPFTLSISLHLPLQARWMAEVDSTIWEVIVHWNSIQWIPSNQDSWNVYSGHFEKSQSMQIHPWNEGQ